jgi:hypothetical protein
LGITKPNNQKGPRRKPGAHRPRQTAAVESMVRRKREESMCCQVRSASVSRRHRKQPRRLAPLSLLTLAKLNLSNPAERQAHDFLCRATSKHERMWKLLDLRRQGDVLLCVVRWVYPDSAANPFSVAEVSLTEAAVHWRYYASPEAAQEDMERRCAAPETGTGAT